MRKEFDVIPKAGKIVASVIWLLPLAMFFLVAGAGGARHALPAFVFLVAAPPVLAVWALLVGYIYGDATRRRMNALLWTLLAIFVPNAIGVILYFILREPLPVFCNACGEATRRGTAYCPRCGAALGPVCPACGKPADPEWAFCAYCRASLAPPPASDPQPAPPGKLAL
jgi:hypothetical protein